MLRKWTALVRSWLPNESWILFTVLASVLGLWIFAVIAGLTMAGRTQAFDEHVLLAVRRSESPGVPIGPRWLELAAIEFTSLGSGAVLLTIIAVVAGYLALERRFGMMGLTLAASLGGMVLSSGLKGAFGRGRPTVVPRLAEVHSPSFPSGHSMISAVVFLTLGALLARNASRRRLRVYFLGVAVLITVLVGVSRVYLGVHYPSDVMAGWTAGALWALLCTAVAHVLQRRGVVQRSGG